jgi:PAS domain S-box-containing protein
MNEQSRKNAEPSEELSALKKRIQELEHSESDRKQAEQEIALLAEIGRVVGSTLDVHQVYERVATEARKLISYDRLLVNRKKNQEGEFFVAYITGVDNPRRRMGDLYPSKGSATGVVMNTRTGILIQPTDAEEIKDLYPNLYETFKTGLRSTMSVPLISMGEVIGSLNFRSKKLKAYTEQDLRLAESIGMQVAGAIANAQLFNDLSETEKSLRESNELFSLFMRHSPIYTFIKEVTPTQSIVLQASDNYRQMIGTLGSEMVGKSMTELFPPGLAAKMTADDWAVVSKGDVLRLDEELNGRSYATIKFPIVRGDKTLLAGYTIDITERKRAEEALRKSEARFQDLFHEAPVGYFEYDAEGCITNVNQTESDMLGYSLEEMIGQPAWKFIVEEETARRQILAKLAGALVPFQGFERTYRRKDGAIFPVLIQDRLNKDEQGNITGIRCAIQDITDRKQAEEKLQHMLESLRKAVGTTIQVMVSAVETRDPYTAGHQIRSAELARAIATEMGLSRDQIDGIRMAGSIHDIGKLSIPAEILSKPTKLSALEFSLIQEHARQGYEILKNVESPWPLAEIVHQHHERMGGSGYPRHLKGDEILLEARILAVADVVESMASHRPYRPALGIDAALEEISKNRGILYDPEVTDTCLKLFQEKGYGFGDLA